MTQDFMNNSFNVPSRGGVDKYTIDGDVWYALKQENWMPDRQQYVIDSWNAKFPERTVDNFEKIMSLIARSQVLSDWYASVMDKYRDSVAVPIHVQDLLPAADYEQISAKINKLNDQVAELSQKRQAEAERYKQALAKLDKEYAIIGQTKENDPLVFILTLTSDKLPLGVLDRIDEYVPRDESDPITTKIYAREQVLRYQRYLINKHNEGEDVYQVVKEQSVSFIDPIQD